MATDPISKYLVPGIPQKQNLSKKCSLKKTHIFKDLHTFSRLFKNSRSTSSQRGTRCRAVSLYICYFSIDKVIRAPPPWAPVTQSHFPTPCDAPDARCRVGRERQSYPRRGNKRKTCHLWFTFRTVSSNI